MKLKMNGLRILIFFLLTWLFAFSVAATPVEKKAEKTHKGVIGKIAVFVNEKDITIADSIRLKINVTVPKGYTAKFPSFAEFGFSADFNERSRRFRATDVTEINKKTADDGSALWTQEFTLEPWLSGNYSILPLMISFFKIEENAGTDDIKEGLGDIPDFNVMTDGIRIKVMPLSDERKELSDLFGQADYKLEKFKKRERRKEDKSDEELERDEQQEKEAEVSLQEKDFPWWIVVVALCIGLSGIVFWYFGRDKVARFFASKSLPAHEIAFKAFKDLKNKNLLQQGMIKEFYYELSFILREYIGNRFGLFAVNQTTEEFFSYLLESNPFDKTAENILQEFSDYADTVKYSLYRPDEKAADESYNTAKSFVDSTKVVQEEAA